MTVIEEVPFAEAKVRALPVVPLMRLRKALAPFSKRTEAMVTGDWIVASRLTVWFCGAGMVALARLLFGMAWMSQFSAVVHVALPVGRKRAEALAEKVCGEAVEREPEVALSENSPVAGRVMPVNSAMPAVVVD